MLYAKIQLADNSVITVKTKKSFDLKCENINYLFLQKCKGFQKVNLLLENCDFPKHAKNQIYSYFGAKFLTFAIVCDGRNKDIKKLPYFSVTQLYTLKN